MSRASDLEVEKRNLIRQSTAVTTVVRILAGVITSIVATRIFWEIASSISISAVGAWMLVQVTVLAYFFSWFFAALKGIEIQKLLLNTTGKTTKFPFAGYFAIAIGFPIGFTAMAVVLFSDMAERLNSIIWSGSLIELLAVLLALFWIWDMLWQWSVRKTMRDRIERTRANLEGPTKRYVELEQLKYLEYFIFGKWRIVRKIVGIVVICALLVLVFYYGEYFKFAVLDITILVSTLIAVIALSFVVLSESWTWIMRLRMLVGVDCLEHLRNEYSLRKIRDKPDT